MGRGRLPEVAAALGRGTHRHDIARILLAGADVEVTTCWGATPFDWAATMGSLKVADLLVAHGADLTIRDARFDATPEGWAIEGHHDVTFPRGWV